MRRINAVVELKRGQGSGIVALQPFLFFARALTFCFALVELKGFQNTEMIKNGCCFVFFAVAKYFQQNVFF